ncbi:MAG: hypothetical protein OEV73_08365 [Desulfobulbaceae bacterium]|nr:hypothetical protein [Desulfobulbaceae bacterium]
MALNVWLATLFVLVGPQQALAVQVHGSPEGLYVHQLGHFFFATALLFLLIILHRQPIGTGKAWRYFKFSLFFFLVWNIDTLLVHWLALRLPDEYFTGGPLWQQRLAAPITGERLAYYLGRFDHLLCLPAMYFLYQSLRLFGREVEMKRRQSDQGAP